MTIYKICYIIVTRLANANTLPQRQHSEVINMNLKEVNIGNTVTVVKLNSEGAIRRRIMDMGITKGVAITVRKVAPLGDPIQITVRGYELSLRKQDAEKIEVRA